MKPTRKISRRSFLGRVAGGAAVIGAMGVIGGGEAEAAQNCSDSDTGRNADPIGRGRRCRRTNDNDPSDPAVSNNNGGNGHNCTDRDTGRNADRPGQGRRCGGRAWTGVTDRDSGPNGDPANYGHRRRSCSDSDTGRNADPINRGRRC